MIYDNGESGSSVLRCKVLGSCHTQSFRYHTVYFAVEGHGSPPVLGYRWDHGRAMASLTIDVDLPPGLKITGYDRFEDGHGIEVDWPLPERCQCEKCGHEEAAHIEFKTIAHGHSGSQHLGPALFLDLSGSLPSLWAMQLPPTHHSTIQTQRRVLYIPLRAVRTAVAHRQFG